MKILYEQNKITLEEYNNEILLIDEDRYPGKGIGRLYGYDYLIPFSDYKKYIFDFKIDV